jgi:hypothetical protein
VGEPPDPSFAVLAYSETPSVCEQGEDDEHRDHDRQSDKPIPRHDFRPSRLGACLSYASAAATAKKTTKPVMAGIAQLELGNSQVPLSERLLLLNIGHSPCHSNPTTLENRLDLAAVPPGR